LIRPQPLFSRFKRRLQGVVSRTVSEELDPVVADGRPIMLSVVVRGLQVLTDRELAFLGTKQLYTLNRLVKHPQSYQGETFTHQ